MDAKQLVLDNVQSGFPLQPDPYAALGQRLGLERSQVTGALEQLRAEGTVRRVGASFDSGKLGYTSTLVAAAVAAQDVERVATIVNGYPGITHNYLRENRYNMWFTLIARGTGEVERILAEISRTSGCADIISLPATRLFKIRVDFGKVRKSTGVHDAREAAARKSARPFDAHDARDVHIVRWAQGNIIADAHGDLLERPFAALEDAGISQEALLERLRELKACGAIRRFGAMVRHRKLGYAFNGMTVWNVEDEAVEACGRAFAEKPFVSHCYERVRAKSWPYNLYAMVHAQTQEELDARVRELREAALCGGEPLVLVSTRELKKTSMRYFE